jgi:Flp pilus assembly protein TadG
VATKNSRRRPSFSRAIWPLRARRCLLGRLPQSGDSGIRPARSASGENGQALVEMAISFPIVATFVFTMIEICLAFYSFCLISECAREGTRYAIVRGATCMTSSNSSCTASSSSINSYVSQIGFPNLGGGTVTPSTTFPDGNQNPGSRVQVHVTYVFPISVPFVPKNSISMGSTSVMYIVQ